MSIVHVIMKKIIFVILLFVFLCFVPMAAVHAEARLYFDPTSLQVSQNSTYQIRVMIDVGSVETIGAGAIIVYNKDVFTIQSVTNGGFYPKFESEILENIGKINIQSFVDAAESRKTGSGAFATISIVPKILIQNEPIIFQCVNGGDDTVILDAQVHNILSCSGTNIALFTGSATALTPIPTREITPVATATVSPQKNVTLAPTSVRNQLVEPTLASPFSAAGGGTSPSQPDSFAATTPLPESIDAESLHNDAASTPQSSTSSRVDPLIYILIVCVVIIVGIGVGYVILRKMRSRNIVVQNFTQESMAPPPESSAPSIPLADSPPYIK